MKVSTRGAEVGPVVESMAFCHPHTKKYVTMLPADALAQGLISQKLHNDTVTCIERQKRGESKPKPMPKGHNCFDNAVPYESDGALGHGWECGICGEFLQAG